MLFGFDSGWIKIWIGFLLSSIIVVFTDFSTPLCKALLDILSFDELKWIKALMILALSAVLSLSLVLNVYLQNSTWVQIKKALKWKEALKSLGNSDLGLGLKLQKLNLIVKEMRSHLDLMAHYPELDFKEIILAQDYELNLATLFRVIDAYSRTLSDEYYRRKYFGDRGGVLYSRK